MEAPINAVILNLASSKHHSLITYIVVVYNMSCFLFFSSPQLLPGCMGVAGILVACSPLVTSTFEEQIIISCLLGMYLGGLVPLVSLITIDLLGIGELGLGFGFMSLFQGFGYLIGPPLAGETLSFNLYNYDGNKFISGPS